MTALVMLYLGVTGTFIQSIDLYAIHTGKPQTDPVMLSINEGRWGNGELAAITVNDLGAPALPQDFNYDQAFQTTLQAMRAQVPDAAPNYVEVRMVDGAPAGQVRLDQDVRAFAALAPHQEPPTCRAPGVRSSKNCIASGESSGSPSGGDATSRVSGWKWYRGSCCGP
jgi:hypothetical protein